MLTEAQATTCILTVSSYLVCHLNCADRNSYPWCSSASLSLTSWESRISQLFHRLLSFLFQNAGLILFFLINFPHECERVILKQRRNLGGKKKKEKERLWLSEDMLSFIKVLGKAALRETSPSLCHSPLGEMAADFWFGFCQWGDSTYFFDSK